MHAYLHNHALALYCFAMLIFYAVLLYVYRRALEPPRFWIEESRTNLLEDSEGFVACSWSPERPDDCPYCSGALCAQCGTPGMHGGPRCEHGSFERHELPIPRASEAIEIPARSIVDSIGRRGYLCERPTCSPSGVTESAEIPMSAWDALTESVSPR